MNRQEIESQYSVTLTDNQWRILLSEVENKDDNETTDEVVLDVVTNIVSYEQEHQWWETQLAKAESQ